jgi:predicted unusual protein kinase regulating ubiquinone biosynthesis (AarF/ABC1/UbiB family)
LISQLPRQGDLHPGNVYISRDGKKFILFDVGIVAEYRDEDHDILVRVLSAFIRKQGRKAGRLMIDESNNRLRRNAYADGKQATLYAIDEERYIDKIEVLTNRASSKDYLMEHLGAYISYICNAASQHHIMMNPTFVSAALAVKVQEGIALALDPSAEIWRVATPIVLESERRRLTGAARQKLGLNALINRFLGGNKEDKRKE